ncbi:MAG TPA: hypothetical protein VF590_00215 [Isosphaeraceae bacterium]
MLAQRLARRGVSLSVGAVAAVLSQDVASAGAPNAVVSSTVEAASRFAAGRAAAAGVISPKVAILAEGVLKAMLMSKLKATIAVVLILGFAATGARGLVTRTAKAQDRPASAEGRAGAPPKRGPERAEAGIAEDAKGGDDAARPGESDRRRLEEAGPALVKEFVATLRRRFGDEDAGELRRFIDPRYLKEHGLQDGRFPIRTVIAGSIYDSQISDDPQTLVIVAGTDAAAKEVFVFRTTLYRGRVYLQPLAPPDPTTRSFTPWILRMKL